jgi:uncharacterized phage protein gp47/JayE
MSNPIDRPDKLLDLTRWNRAGLSRFNYIDGDAAVWLEELRIAAMGLVARDAEIEERLPETWRYRFSESSWPDANERQAFIDSLGWKSLAREYPDKPETARDRNARLLEQYRQSSGEYGWEIMRAAARATHVLLGHLNAYANEGYLRTATQWDNLARLAAMVNYQPAPPSSATTAVGLIVDPTEDGAAVEIPRGMAMKYAPPEGGAPIVFETLKPLKVHADLNQARAENWNYDPTLLSGTDEEWTDDKDAELAPGTVGVLADIANPSTADAVGITDVQRDTDNQIALLSLSQVNPGWKRGDVELHIEPKAIRRGSPRSTDGVLVLKMDTAANYSINSIIRLHYGSGSKELRVMGNTDGHLKLKLMSVLNLAHGQSVTVETLVPVSNVSSQNLAPAAFGTKVFYLDHSAGTDTGVTFGSGSYVYAKNEEGDVLSDRAPLGIDFSAITRATGFLYAETDGAKQENATVVDIPPAVDASAPNTEKRVITFSGKPPKGLSTGDLMVQKSMADNGLRALQVVGIAMGDDSYTLQFHVNVTGGNIDNFKPDEFQYHGPLLRSLRPHNYNRNPNNAFDGPEIILDPISKPARELLRLGKSCLIEDERRQVPSVLATLVEAIDDGVKLRLLFEPEDGLGDFKKGWTTLNLNAVNASHGETKSPKVLGSGNGEVARQRFPFNARKVSFIPSSVAETGVAPDMDVEVGGVVWGYRDLIDPTADDTDSYSVSINEDDSLAIHFRRRLPTGTNNIVVRRHRSGVGPSGSIPARSFVKPMKKHRYVRAVTQPFAATGGADREPVEDLRVNAPASLTANSRAVSLRDFERICRRRSDVWQASARPLTSPTISESVAIVIVPANGGNVGVNLRQDLIDFVEGRATPGVRVAIEDYVPVYLTVEATIRVEVEAYDKTEVQATAQAALIDEFSLERRLLGQPVYIAEVAAALERVNGVKTVTVQSFSVSSAEPIKRTAKTSGSDSAFFPFQHQLISTNPTTAGSDMTVIVEAI